MSDDADRFELRRFPPWALAAAGVPLLAMAVGAAWEGFYIAALGFVVVLGPMLWMLSGVTVLTHDRAAGALRVEKRRIPFVAPLQAHPLSELRGARAEPIDDAGNHALVLDIAGNATRVCDGDPERVLEAARWVSSLRQRPGRKSSAAASD